MATSSAEETSSLVGSQHDNDDNAEADDILYRDEISLVDDDDSLPPLDLDAEADVDVAALVDELELDLDLEGDAEVRSHGTSAEAETVKAKPFASKSDGGGSSYEIDVDKFENEIRGSNRSSQTGSGRELSDLDVSNPSFLSDSCGSIDVDQTRAFSRRFSYVAETARRAAAEKNERMKENLRRTSERPPSDAHSPASDRDPAVPPVDRSTSTAPGGVAHSVGGLSLDEDVAKVDEILNRTAVYVVVFWIGLVALSYAICPPDRIVWLEGTERNACLVELSILATAVVMKHGPLLWEINLIDLSPPGRGPTGKGRSLMSAPRFSGILVGGLVVQGIAILTAVIMVCFPVPVMVDPVLGSRVHLIRWCEWTPLAGFMTLMTECIDAPIYDGSRLTHDWRAKFVLSANETVSTLCGFFFPFCPNLWTWSLVMAFSTVTYSAILFRYAQKRRAFRNISRGNSVDEIELYDRSRMSLALLGMCCVIWTGILVAFFASNAGHFVVPASWTIFHDPAVTMIEECFMDLVAKILYMALIIEAHYAAFDEAKRANRRLAELKNTMSVVWENSSDTVAISVRKVSGNVTSMVSPSFFRPALIARKRNNTEDVSAIVMELACKEIQKKRDSFTAASAITTLNLPRVLLRVVQKAEFAGIDLHSTSGKNSFDGIIHEGNKLDPMSLRVLAFTDMLSRAWQSNRDELVFEHDAILQEGGNRTKFEVKVTRLEENAIVVVVRDVSERYRRFEAEKRFVFETTARQKDAEANRFTRHEVKNGLLAAIEICGNIREQFSEDFNLLQKENEVSLVTEQSLKTRVEHISELDRTLHEVLDIVLAETMARDVIHEMYIPRMERVDVNYILTHTRGFTASHKQFSVVCNPSPLPILLLDQGLFKCIHGNAIRNALKYGEKGGPIRTEATYYFETGWLEMKVINLPGPGHAQLVAMGPRASELVFSHGTRLHKDSNSKQRSHSAGDGAWIMHKCATILGGSVQITFEQDHTEFVFRAPCKVYDAPLREADHFHLPSGVWGIAIDDSKIQRKLLRRFFVHAGIQEHHQIILGQNNEEISSFVEFVVDFIKRHPNNLFLIIVDENLELGDGISSHETISGSECIQRIRVTLDSENEKKMLALVRSANDSPQDLAIYTSRAHGYMPKVPLQGMSVREMVAPLWAERFPLVKRGSDNEPEEPDPEDRVTSIESLRDLTLISPAELKSLLEQVDALAVRNADNNLANRWPVLWEKLHQLKGDLKTVNVDDKFTRAIKEIESMRGGTAPADFMSKWLVIRTDVVFDSGK